MDGKCAARQLAALPLARPGCTVSCLVTWSLERFLAQLDGSQCLQRLSTHSCTSYSCLSIAQMQRFPLNCSAGFPGVRTPAALPNTMALRLELHPRGSTACAQRLLSKSITLQACASATCLCSQSVQGTSTCTPKPRATVVSTPKLPIFGRKFA